MASSTDLGSADGGGVEAIELYSVLGVVGGAGGRGV